MRRHLLRSGHFVLFSRSVWHSFKGGLRQNSGFEELKATPRFQKLISCKQGSTKKGIDLRKKTITARLVRKEAALKIADIEYCVLWDDATRGWGVFRNGTQTEVAARRKLKSAVDCAIRDAKAELENSAAVITVTCFQGRKLENMWRGSSTPNE